MLVANGLLTVTSEADLPRAFLSLSLLQGCLQDLMIQELIQLNLDYFWAPAFATSHPRSRALSNDNPTVQAGQEIL